MRRSSAGSTSGSAYPSTWVIDPELDLVKPYRRTGERFERVAELMLEGGDVLTTPLLPGLDMPLAKIFEV